MEAGNLGQEEGRPCADGTWKPGPRCCTFIVAALTGPGRVRPVGRGQRGGAPLLEGGDSQDVELASVGKGKRPGLKRAHAFPSHPVYCVLSCKADAVIVISRSRSGAQAQREDVERDWPQLEGGRVPAPAVRLSVQRL